MTPYHYRYKLAPVPAALNAPGTEHLVTTRPASLSRDIPGWYDLPDGEGRVRLAGGAVVDARLNGITRSPGAMASHYARTLGELALLAIHSGRRVSL